MRHRIMMVVGLLLTLVGPTGCALSSEPGLTVPIAGTWTLQTVNGQPLPFTFTGGKTLTSDVFTLNTNGSYTQEAKFSDGTSSLAEGVYTVIGNQIAFDDLTNTIRFFMKLDGDTMTETAGSFTEVYRKT